MRPPANSGLDKTIGAEKEEKVLVSIRSRLGKEAKTTKTRPGRTDEREKFS